MRGDRGEINSTTFSNEVYKTFSARVRNFRPRECGLNRCHVTLHSLVSLEYLFGRLAE